MPGRGCVPSLAWFSSEEAVPYARAEEEVVNTQLERAERGVLGWIDRDITGPMADFQDPNQEWRRLF